MDADDQEMERGRMSRVALFTSRQRQWKRAIHDGVQRLATLTAKRYAQRPGAEWLERDIAATIQGLHLVRALQHAEATWWPRGWPACHD